MLKNDNISENYEVNICYLKFAIMVLLYAYV